jgi:hypothetical protein
MHESVALLAGPSEPFRFISVFSYEYRDSTLNVATATSSLISSSTMHASFTSYAQLRLWGKNVWDKSTL